MYQHKDIEMYNRLKKKPPPLNIEKSCLSLRKMGHLLAEVMSLCADGRWNDVFSGFVLLVVGFFCVSI